MTSPSDLIRGGKLRTGEVRVCVDPDLVVAYEHLLTEQAAERSRTRDSLAGGRVNELQEQIDAALEAMEASTITLTFTALPRRRFRALCDEHPPRSDAEGRTPARDRAGVNFDTFFPILVRESLIGPELSTADQDRLFDELLTDRQWDDLTDDVWLLNRAKVDVPFSPAGSTSRRPSDES